MRRILFFVVVAAGLTAAYAATPPLARSDDAYIALHSARVVLSRQDPVFGTAALVGATCPAYIALLSTILALGIRSGDTALRLANASAIVAYAAAVWYLGKVIDLSKGRRLSLVVIALGSGVVIFVNLTNGLETGWAIAILTFAIASAHAGNIAGVTISAALLPFLRPDLAPASVLVLSYGIRGRSRRQQVLALALAGIVAAPWLIWTRIDTGSWITQTIRAKRLFFAEGCLPWLKKAEIGIEYSGIALAQTFPLGVGILALGRDRLGRVGLLAIGISLIAYVLEFPSALAHTSFRYQAAILIPWLCYGCALGFSRIPTLVGASAAVAVIAAHATFPHDQDLEFAREVRATAEWADVQLPADAVLLVHDAGAISEFAHHRAVDLVGLKSPSSVDTHARWTRTSCLADRGTAIAAIARDSGASHLIALTGWDVFLRPNLEAGGFVLTPIREPPPGKPGYTVFRLERPGATPTSQASPRNRSTQ